MNRVKSSNRKIKHQLNIRDINKNSANEVGHVIAKIKTRELVFTFLGVIIFLVLISSFSYIVFSSVQKRENYNTLKSGTLIIDYSDIKTGMGDVVTLIGEENITDKKVMSSDVYEFKVTNSSNKIVKYEIILQDDLEMIEIDQCKNSLVEKENVQFSLNGSAVKKLSSVYKKNRYVLTTTKVEANGKQDYKLRIFMDNNENTIDKHYHGKIVVREIKEK